MSPTSLGLRRIIGLLLGLGALLLLQACSAIKLAYNNAPQFGYFWLDGYVDFRDDQSIKTKDELDKLFAWHRAEELPKLADLLKKAQRLSAGDLTAQQVCGVYSEVRERINATVQGAEPAGLWLASTLNAAQINHLAAKLRKNSDQWRKDWQAISAAERFEKRLKNNLERAEDFYGKLDETQVNLLKNAMATSHYDPALSDAERQRRQLDLLLTLRQISGNLPTGAAKPAPAEAQALFRAYVARVNHSPHAAYDAYAEKVNRESCAAMAQLHNTASPTQRDRALRRLAAYELSLRELAAQR